MFTDSEAREKVEALLLQKGKYIDGGLAVVDALTVRKPYGWIFFYDSRRHIETGSIMDAIAGNGPVVVLVATGEAIALGTARHPDEEISRFEQERTLRPAP